MARWSSQLPAWIGEISNREAKEALAAKVAVVAQDGETVGCGSGSTSYLTINALGERVGKEGLRIEVIPTSVEMALACRDANLPVTSLLEHRPDWSFDGADEVDPDHNLIKGRGGAMLREKLLIDASARTFIVIDKSKFVDRLGSNFPVPVEVVPEALMLAEEELLSLGADSVTLRTGSGTDGPAITELGNVILDVRFSEIGPDYESRIKSLTGVVESGLFQGRSVEIISS